MLKSLNKNYFIIGLGAFLFFIPWVQSYYISLHILNIFSFLTFFLMVNYASGFKNYSKHKLSKIVLGYSLLFVFLYNWISYSYNADFFIFSTADAVAYDSLANDMANMGPIESIQYYLTFYSVDDLGMGLLLSTVYRVIESNLAYNLVNIFIGVLTSIYIFRISTHLMTRKYAFLAALAYSLSSFVIWHHASGLKESIMVSMVILFFDQYYMFLKNYKIKYLFVGIVSVLVLILFRPAIMFFCLGAIGFGVLVKQGLSLKKISILFVIAITFTFTFSFLEDAFTRFLMGGDMTRVVQVRMMTEMVKGSLPFTYSVNVLAQIAGPLPTIIPNVDPKLSFYFPGLLFRVLLSFFFWIGTYYVFKYKEKLLYPLIFFSVMEMASLVLILEGLELRKSLPHLPLVFIISFWFIGNFELLPAKKKKRIKTLFLIFNIVLIPLLIYWNFR